MAKRRQLDDTLGRVAVVACLPCGRMAAELCDALRQTVDQVGKRTRGDPARITVALRGLPVEVTPVTDAGRELSHGHTQVTCPRGDDPPDHRSTVDVLVRIDVRWRPADELFEPCEL